MGDENTMTPTPSAAEFEAHRTYLLNLYRFESERLVLLLNFLSSPIQASRDENGKLDPDVESAHNLVTTAALQCIRTIASGGGRG